MKTDSLLAVQALDEGVNLYSCYRHLIHEILALNSYFKDCNFNMLVGLVIKWPTNLLDMHGKLRQPLFDGTVSQKSLYLIYG